MKGSGSIMVWGCFSWHGVGSLTRISGIMDQHGYKDLLERELLNSATHMGIRRRFVFQQDLSPIHTAPAPTKFFAENRITVLKWAPQSPDLNPIENLWKILDDSVPLSERVNVIRFSTALQKTWEELPQQTLQILVNSIPKRLMLIKKARGLPIGY
jgi:hypothetical protein